MTTKNFRVKNGLEVGNNTTIHVTANSSGLYGNGAGVTSVDAATVGGNTAATLRAFSSNATNITTGTLNNARLPSAISVTSLSGNGAGITSINATSISTGTLNNARLPSTISVSTLTVTGSVSIAQANVVNITLTDASTINWNTALGQIATVTLGGNRTVAAPTNLKVGTYILHVIQDGTGNRTLTWNSVFKWTGGFAPVLSTAANARDVFSFISDGTNLYGSYLPDVK